MTEFIDQIGRPVLMDRTPSRIVSLVPSLTELLFSLGLKEKMVGRTKFCIHPSKDVSQVDVVGGTKKFSVQRIRDLNPDLIIANKEENDRDLVRELMTDIPVWVSDVSDLYSAVDLIHGLGKITGTDAKAHIISETILDSFATLKPEKQYNALYFIWKDPWMVAGKNTFIHDMMHRAGMLNLATDERYPSIPDDALDEYDPDVIFLSSEPYPFSEEHRLHMEHRFPRAVVVLVNGEYFSWYGSRLLESTKYFQSVIELISAPALTRSSQNPG